ncbi:alpha/beta hydrolase [Maridesulfovibrio zosterae]|uniref:alpha/beta hydrolase n=1 Tax=Maridesulfovibrio zosterae TaxID=82171 RepID=UPI00040C3011|nr:alpha/beta hydrolase [Maridesulfovibrio zosterae]
MKKINSKILYSLLTTLLLSFFLSSCTSFNHQSFGREHGFDSKVFSEKKFSIQGYQRGKAKRLRVYIEGDGKAWLSRSRPSSDPTPNNPVSFYLAAEDNSPAVLYLARPCQYVEKENRRNCIVPFWTSARFSELIINDLNKALDEAKSVAGANDLELVGYSGGGAVAVLLAARRDDVDLIVTVAGNLDHSFWTDFHNVSPLRYSLNPADVAEKVQHIRQIHIVSFDDAVIPESVCRSYLSRMTDLSMVTVIRVDDIGHTGDWRLVVKRVLP